MASPAGHRHVFRFGLFEADPASGELLKQGQRVRLQDQPFRMLILLLERPGEVVTREELRQKLWPQDTFVEFNNGLNVAVKKIRDALHDDAENPRFIETVPRRGYRFIAPLAAGAPPTLELVDKPPAVPPGAAEIPPRRSPWPRYAAVALLAALVAAAAIFAGRRAFFHAETRDAPAPSRTALPHRRSVAVMAFRNGSGHREDEWLSTAIAEMLSTELGVGEKLRLVPGEDVGRVKRELHLESAASLAKGAAVQAGRNLGADVLVAGSFTVMGEAPNRRVRVDFRLQDAANGEIVAEAAETGSEQKLFELIAQLGMRVRRQLGVPVMSADEEGAVRALLPRSPDAARLYAEGIAHLRALDAAGARDLLTQAIAAEPRFPLSHIALASTWRMLGYDQKARTEAKRSLELASALPRTDRFRIEGRMSEMSGEVDKAIAAYRGLLALSPDNLEDGLSLAEAQTFGGKAAEALATLDGLRRLPPPLSQDPRIEILQARALSSLDDPHVLEAARRAAAQAEVQGARLLRAKAQIMECSALITAVRLDEAETICAASQRAFLEAGIPSDAAQASRFLGDIRLRQGRLAEALEFFRQALKINQDAHDDRGTAVSFNEMAIVHEAQGNLKQAEQLYRDSYRMFLKIGHRKNAGVLAGNLAGILLSEGRLPPAEGLFEQNLALSQEVGAKDAEAGAHDGLARLELLRGNLPQARQHAETAVALRRGKRDQFNYVATLNGFSAILVAEGDLKGARQKLAEALQIANQAGARQQAAETVLRRAQLDLEDGRASEAEPAIRQALDVFVKEKMGDDIVEASVALSQSLRLQNKTAEAQAALDLVRPAAATSANRVYRLMFTIADARARSAASPTPAQAELRKCIASARALGFAGFELEARLALAETLLPSAPGARQHLALLARDAHARGFELIARKAAKLL